MAREVSVESIFAHPRPSTGSSRIPVPIPSGSTSKLPVASQPRVRARVARAALGEIHDPSNLGTRMSATPSTKRKFIKPRGTPRPGKLDPTSSAAQSNSPRPVATSSSRFHHQTTHSFQLEDGEETMLMDVQPPSSFSGISSPEPFPMPDQSSVTERSFVRSSRVGPGKLMTPLNSQQSNADHSLLETTSIPHPALRRLPTPPSSQSGPSSPPSKPSHKVRSRAIYSPPRPQQHVHSPSEPSPNPRSKKSPKLDSASTFITAGKPISRFSATPAHASGLLSTPQTASQVSATARASATAQNKRRQSARPTMSPVSTPQEVKGSRKGPIPSTAPAAIRKPRQSAANSSYTKHTAKTVKRRESLPVASGRRKSTTPLSVSSSCARRKSAILPQRIPIEPGEDPLLLRGPDGDETARWLELSERSRMELMTTSRERLGSQQPSEILSASLRGSSASRQSETRSWSKPRSLLRRSATPRPILFPSPPHEVDTNPKTRIEDSMDEAPEFDMPLFDTADGWDSGASDNEVDDRCVGEDTFLHALGKNGKTSTPVRLSGPPVRMSSTSPAIGSTQVESAVSVGTHGLLPSSVDTVALVSELSERDGSETPRSISGPVELPNSPSFRVQADQGSESAPMEQGHSLESVDDVETSIIVQDNSDDDNPGYRISRSLIGVEEDNFSEKHACPGSEHSPKDQNIEDIIAAHLTPEAKRAWPTTDPSSPVVTPILKVATPMLSFKRQYVTRRDLAKSTFTFELATKTSDRINEQQEICNDSASDDGIQNAIDRSLLAEDIDGIGIEEPEASSKLREMPDSAIVRDAASDGQDGSEPSGSISGDVTMEANSDEWDISVGQAKPDFGSPNVDPSAILPSAHSIAGSIAGSDEDDTDEPARYSRRTVASLIDAIRFKLPPAADPTKSDALGYQELEIEDNLMSRKEEEIDAQQHVPEDIVEEATREQEEMTQEKEGEETDVVAVVDASAVNQHEESRGVEDRDSVASHIPEPTQAAFESELSKKSPTRPASPFRLTPLETNPPVQTGRKLPESGPEPADILLQVTETPASLPEIVSNVTDRGDSNPPTAQAKTHRICLTLVPKGVIKVEPVSQTISLLGGAAFAETALPASSGMFTDPQDGGPHLDPTLHHDPLPDVAAESPVVPLSSAEADGVATNDVSSGDATISCPDESGASIGPMDTPSPFMPPSQSGRERPLPPVLRFPRNNSPKGPSLELVLASRVKHPSRLSNYITASASSSPEKLTVEAGSRLPSDPIRDVVGVSMLEECQTARSAVAEIATQPEDVNEGDVLAACGSASASALGLSGLSGRSASLSAPGPSSAGERSPGSRSFRSLADEMATSSQGDMSTWSQVHGSLVEVSSLDPRAAARAAAILKMNHAYIQDGILPVTPSAASIPLPLTPSTSTTRRIHRTPRPFESPYFESIELSRHLSEEELLHEAELEIVANSRHRSRGLSMARDMDNGYSSDASEMLLPGGWARTPRKRKMSEAMPEADRIVAKTSLRSTMGSDRPWGVKEWKRLEKVYRAEKLAWSQDQGGANVSPPGWLGWAAAKFGAPSAKNKEWDIGRVVQRFLELECAEGSDGDWSSTLIRLRVEAIERRQSRRKGGGADARLDAHSSKRQRTNLETPRRQEATDNSIAIVPPSTIRRLFGSIWGSSFTVARSEKSAGVKEDNATTPVSSSLTLQQAVGEQSVDPPSITAPSQVQPVKQVRTSTITDSTPSRFQPAHPSSPAWSPALPVPGAMPRSPKPKPPPLHLQKPSVATDSTGPNDPAGIYGSSPVTLSATSSTPTIRTKSLYPPLYPDLSKRAEPIRNLFETPSTTRLSPSSSVSVPISIPRGRIPSPSVKELAKSFEDEGVLSKMYKGKAKEREKNALRRVQNRGG
ncbi:hypothetical protein BD324DRAFT_658110 [Kockovaella imperatae]|uniref:Uncharacterized protein n=1 Tax=Kockovaella imperatae TaxID=4999 RepID=A0A1Y1U7T7_9TREE|nr:hypothetical protein BD324DRAFT_658110 [Kockovaella imperatae]ORX34073.1 hypothetical protein BD324DRAFT_658110 [Kockovaella imperatae]